MKVNVKQYIALCALVLTTGCSHIQMPFTSEKAKAAEVDDQTVMKKMEAAIEEQSTAPVYKPAWKIAGEDPSSLLVVVNKDKPLSSSYVPSNLRKLNVRSTTSSGQYMREEAATAAEQMFQQASADGIRLIACSGYRSYERQAQIYKKNVRKQGQAAADSISAEPGKSEHQTGLALDITSKSVGNDLVAAFGETAEGKWLASHAHEFGFIIRYPQDKTDITGYSYEPWHVRYVGVEVATYLYENNLTIEESLAQ